MGKYVYVGLGGAIGAILRYAFKNAGDIDIIANFPVSTLFINVVGAFILAFYNARLNRIRVGIFNRDLAVTVGFAGGFTTFSTICKESFLMESEGALYKLMIYILAAILIGYIAVVLGNKAGKFAKR